MAWGGVAVSLANFRGSKAVVVDATLSCWMWFAFLLLNTGLNRQCSSQLALSCSTCSATAVRSISLISLIALSLLSSIYTMHRQIRIGGASEPFIYPKNATSYADPAAYERVNDNYLRQLAGMRGQICDRLPIFLFVPESIYTPLPPVYFDVIGGLAGEGINLYDCKRTDRGYRYKEALINSSNAPLAASRRDQVYINISWPGYINNPVLSEKFRAYELCSRGISRYQIAERIANKYMEFFDCAAETTIDPASMSWRVSRLGGSGITIRDLHLVSLNNIGENVWRANVYVIRDKSRVMRG